MRPVLVHIGGFAVPTHGFFVALGILVGALVFYREARRRGELRFETLVAVTGALVGGAVVRAAPTPRRGSQTDADRGGGSSVRAASSGA